MKRNWSWPASAGTTEKENGLMRLMMKWIGINIFSTFRLFRWIIVELFHVNKIRTKAFCHNYPLEPHFVTADLALDCSGNLKLLPNTQGICSSIWTVKNPREKFLMSDRRLWNISLAAALWTCFKTALKTFPKAHKPGDNFFNQPWLNFPFSTVPFMRLAKKEFRDKNKEREAEKY